MDYGRPELADALAAEYVAGTLRGRARSRFENLLPGHPALQRAVREWQGRLIPLTTSLPEETPPARVWQGIERALWPAVFEKLDEAVARLRDIDRESLLAAAKRGSLSMAAYRRTLDFPVLAENLRRQVEEAGIGSLERRPAAEEASARTLW